MSKILIKSFDSSKYPVQNNVRCKDGVIVAAPYRYDQSDRVIIDTQFANGREGLVDCGVVLASGVEGFEKGDVVIYPPFGGLWIQNCFIGAYWYKDVIVLKNDKRFKKVVSLGKLEGTRIRPHDTTVFCVADELPTEQGGILLVEQSKRWTGSATVLETGKLAEDVEPGDVVLYDPTTVKQASVDDAIAEFYNHDRERMFFIDSDNILAVIE